MRTKWMSGIVAILVSLGLTGCGKYAPDMSSMNPFGGDDERQTREQQEDPGPLVMPGELEDENSSGSSEQNRDQSSSTTSSQNTVDFGSDESSNTSTSDGDSRKVIAPDIGSRSKDAEKIADEAHDAYSNGDIATAISKFKEAHELDPDNADYMINIGSLYFNEGNYRQAREYYERVVSEVPTDVEANFYLGAAHARLENSTKARRYLEKVLDLDPTHQRAQNLLDELS